MTNSESWEADFDKKFCSKVYGFYGQSRGPKELKQFITELLAKQREEIEIELEANCNNRVHEAVNTARQKGYNEGFAECMKLRESERR